MLSSIFYDASLELHYPKTQATVEGDTNIRYLAAIDATVPAMRVTKPSFEETEVMGRLIDPGSTFSIEMFNTSSAVEIPVGTKFKYVKAGSLNTNQWFEVINREKRLDFYFKSQSIHAKVCDAPKLWQS